MVCIAYPAAHKPGHFPSLPGKISLLCIACALLPPISGQASPTLKISNITTIMCDSITTRPANKGERYIGTILQRFTSSYTPDNYGPRSIWDGHKLGCDVLHPILPKAELARKSLAKLLQDLPREFVRPFGGEKARSCSNECISSVRNTGWVLHALMSCGDLSLTDGVRARNYLCRINCTQTTRVRRIFVMKRQNEWA